MTDSHSCSDSEYLQVLSNINQCGSSSVQVDISSEPFLRFNGSLLTAIKHKSWLEARAAFRLGGSQIKLMWEPITRLAIEFHEPSRGLGEGEGSSSVQVEEVGGVLPIENKSRGKKRDKVGDETDDELGSDLEDDVEMDSMALGSSFSTDDSDSSVNFENRNNEAKKLRLDNLTI